MTNLPRIKPGALTSAIDAQIAELLRMRIPSLRHIHNSKRSLIDLDFDRQRQDPLRLTAPHGRVVHGSHKHLAAEWIDMLESVLRPGQLAGVKARIRPSPKPVIEQTPGYLSATTLAVSTWPGQLPWPEGVDLTALMKARVWNEGEQLCVDMFLELLGQSEAPEPLSENEDVITQANQKLGSYWGRCCEKILPWLYDGGISEIEILVPVGRGDILPGDLMPPGSASVH